MTTTGTTDSNNGTRRESDSTGEIGDKRLATVRALLAKAEATQFPEEAEAFVAKATELMSRYAIDEATLWEAEGREQVPSERRIVLARPYTAQKGLLVHQVGKVFGCRTVRLGSAPGATSETVHVFGFESDLVLVETLVTSLLVQMITSMSVHESGIGRVGYTGADTAGWRRSFIMGFIDRVGTRLQEEHHRAVRNESVDSRSRQTGASEAGDRSSSLSIVLADRERDVEQAMRREYPNVRSASVGSGSSLSGRRAGQDAGSRADLGGRAVGGRRALASG